MSGHRNWLKVKLLLKAWLCSTITEHFLKCLVSVEIHLISFYRHLTWYMADQSTSKSTVAIRALATLMTPPRFALETSSRLFWASGASYNTRIICAFVWFPLWSYAQPLTDRRRFSINLNFPWIPNAIGFNKAQTHDKTQEREGATPSCSKNHRRRPTAAVKWQNNGCCKGNEQWHCCYSGSSFRSGDITIVTIKEVSTVRDMFSLWSDWLCQESSKNAAVLTAWCRCVAALWGCAVINLIVWNMRMIWFFLPSFKHFLQLLLPDRNIVDIKIWKKLFPLSDVPG